jgi:hypothetical protein
MLASVRPPCTQCSDKTDRTQTGPGWACPLSPTPCCTAPPLKLSNRALGSRIAPSHKPQLHFQCKDTDSAFTRYQHRPGHWQEQQDMQPAQGTSACTPPNKPKPRTSYIPSHGQVRRLQLSQLPIHFPIAGVLLGFNYFSL